MIKTKSTILKKWKVYGYQGRLAGYKCIVRCQWCFKEKELIYSKIENGGGKFCSQECYTQYKKTLTGNKSNQWKGGHDKKAITKRWQKENKEQYYFLLRRRDYLKKNAVGSHTFKEWKNLKEICNYTCVCCYKREPEIILTEDHIIPLSREGNNYISNIQPLCKSCNSKKNTKTIDYLEKSL